MTRADVETHTAAHQPESEPETYDEMTESEVEEDETL